MISQAVEYSLRAMALLAKSRGAPLTVQLMAAEGKIPAPYLSKLLQGLTRGGLVRSQRGVGGGYVLTRPAEEITLADVVNVVDPLKRITHCPLGISDHAQLCPLHRKLDQALATVERAFQETTLGSLFPDGCASPLCTTEPIVSLDLPSARPRRK